MNTQILIDPLWLFIVGHIFFVTEFSPFCLTPGIFEKWS